MNTVAPFNSAIAFVRSVESLHEQVQQAAQQATTAFQEGMQRAAQMFAEAMAGYEQYATEDEPEVIRVLTQGCWIGMERHFTITQARAVLHIYKNDGEAAMNEAINGYFNKDNAALLPDREPILRDALSAHRAGQSTLTIPALLPLADGLCAEILGITRTDSVKILAQDWQSREREVWVDLFRAVVDDLIYKNYSFAADPAPYLTRHGILHGRVADYWSPHNSTRVFLLLDAVADRWRENQSALSVKAHA